MTAGPAPRRVLLLVPARSYRAADFLRAAARMDLDLVIGSDGALPLGGRPVVPVDPADPGGSTRRILAAAGPVAAVVAADTPMLVLAAEVAHRMGLPHNPADAVRNATDKTRQRQRWAAAGIAQPAFRIVPAPAGEAAVAGEVAVMGKAAVVAESAAAARDVPASEDVPAGQGGPACEAATAGDDAIREAAEATGFPCVVKAVSLSASQGILRADGPGAAVAAARRIRRILAAARRPHGEPLLIEEYLPGPELSIDGLLTGGGLTPTVIFDKPTMTAGPTFEETLLVTPSRLPAPVLAAAVRSAGQAARALGLTSGPIHAELRIGEHGGQPRPAMLELAARCIGGLCSRALRFGGGESLEELVLANALGRSLPAPSDQPPSDQPPSDQPDSLQADSLQPDSLQPVRPAGAFMLPVPRPGVLRAVEGRVQAAAVPGITGLTITIPPGQRVAPLPEGDRYLGFIFAEAATPHDVEQALTTAAGHLRVIID